MNLSKQFDSTLNVQKNIISISCTRQFSAAQESQFVKNFNRYGFAILQCQPHTSVKDNLLNLRERFGRTFSHTRGDKNNLITISATGQTLPGFIGTSEAEHPLHTDGQYMRNPPKITAIACETPAKYGGVSHLFSGALLLELLQKHCPKKWVALFESDVYGIHREGSFLRRPIFEYQSSDILSMAFRYDQTLPVEIKKEAQQVFNVFLNILREPRHLLPFMLMSHQILLLDNYSVLHGRSAFEKQSPRTLHRLVFDGEGSFAKENLIFGFKDPQSNV